MSHPRPLHPFHRAVIGIDRFFDELDAMAARHDSYPPYDIEQTGDDAYRLVMAVAGFKTDDLSIEVKDKHLAVRGKATDDKDRRFVHRGIARRNFERRFMLGEHVRVDSAGLKDGLLSIDFVREVPEEEKPRTINISAS